MSDSGMEDRLYVDGRIELERSLYVSVVSLTSAGRPVRGPATGRRSVLGTT